MHGDDVRMAELSRGAGLALEALQLFRLGEQARMRNLQGDNAIEFGIAGLPDGAEPAQAETLQELELAQTFHAACGIGMARVAQTKGAATAWAEHLVRAVVSKQDRAVTLRAADLGGCLCLRWIVSGR